MAEDLAPAEPAPDSSTVAGQADSAPLEYHAVMAASSPTETRKPSQPSVSSDRQVYTRPLPKPAALKARQSAKPARWDPSLDEEPSRSLPSLAPGPFQVKAAWQQSLVELAETVNKGESFSHALGRLGVSGHEARRITDAASELVDLTRIQAGSEVKLFRNKFTRAPVRLEFDWPGQPRVVMYRTPAGYAASTYEPEAIRCLSAASGVVRSSLWSAAVGEGRLPAEVVMAFADIFRYDIDFLTETRQGDAFEILYEKNYCLGDAVGAGRVLAARYVNDGEVHEAFYFENEEGDGGYYTAEGKSLKKMFLKSPLQYRRISSHFSYSRMHPILKYRRPHLGVDYAAPTGTPVESIGDGRVVFVGRKGGYGKMVIVKHKNNYVSQYAHLSRCASGLKRGRKVRQGQLVGYVGATGLATGPHLDFRVKVNGKFVDPLTLKMDSNPPIEKADLPAFKQVVQKRLAEMTRQLADAGRPAE